MEVDNLLRFKRLLQTDKQAVSIHGLAEEFIQYNRDIDNSPATIKTRKSHVEQFARFCGVVGVHDISFVTNQFIDQYFVEYRKTHSEGTTNTGKRILKVFLSWIQDYKEISVRYNPSLIKSKKIKYKTPQAIDVEDVARAIAHAGEQDKMVICLLVETGMRPIELSRIKVGDFHDRYIDIHGKGNVDRTVTMTDTLAAILSSYISKRKLPKDSFLFTNETHFRGRPLDPKTIWRRVTVAFDRCGVKATPRNMRHTFAVNLLMNGCDVMTIKDLLGHEYVTTTQQYLRLTDNQRQLNYDKHFGTSFYT